jgi:hypothetical protein
MRRSVAMVVVLTLCAVLVCVAAPAGAAHAGTSEDVGASAHAQVLRCGADHPWIDQVPDHDQAWVNAVRAEAERLGAVEPWVAYGLTRLEPWVRCRH